MRRVVPLLAVALVLAACDEDVPTDITPPNPLIQDASQNGGNPAFFWLHPIVENNVFAGEFNPQLKPRVSICRLDLTLDPADCAPGAPLLATWTVSTGLLVEERQYHVDWDTEATPTDFTASYRIQVFLHEQPGAELLGVADVEFVSNAQELRNINTNEQYPLGEERTLGIRFRIEKGVSCGAATDCGEATIGPSGGTVTTATGEAGVAIPAGAVDGDLLVKIRKVDPDSQPWGQCLPTGLRQVEGCYEFDTEPAISEVQESGLDKFNELVVVGVCPDPDPREDYLLLHKYDPEHPEAGVVALDGAPESFLTCPGDVEIGSAGGVLSRLARAVARFVTPRPLFAKDAGRGGVTDAFSYIGWAEPVDLSLIGSLPLAVLPSTAVSTTVQATTEHNHENAPLDASDHTLRFDYTDAAGAEAALAPVVTNAAGQASPAWTLTGAVGVHTLDVSTRLEILIDDEPFLVPDPTAILTLTVGAYTSADACEDTEADCGQALVGPAGDTLVTENGFAGVAIPAGAVDGPVLVTIQRVDPEGQPWGRCLPTGLRQEEGCYLYDTEPALSAVNEQDAFNQDVVVAVCIDPGAVREDYLTLHKYDPENPLDGVVELAGAAEDFLTCDGFAGVPNGFLGRLAQAGRRLLSPVLGAVAPRPLFAKDAGRGGVTDAFSFIGWAEPVTLSLATEPDGTFDGITDVVVTALTAHNHEGFPATPADGHTIRFEHVDPSDDTTVTHVVTAIAGSVAEARISLTAEPGTHHVRVSTQQEILIEEELIVAAGGGAGYGLFGAPRLALASALVPFLVPDPTGVLDSGPILVEGGVGVAATILYAGNGLAGVLVELVQGSPTNPPSYSATTGEGGTAFFTGVADGSYYLKAYGPTDEYLGWTAISVVVEGQSIEATLDLPKNIVLLTPEQGSTVPTRNPTLTWTPNPEAAIYTVQLNVTTPWTLVEQAGAPEASYTVQTPLQAGENYTWQVDAYDEAGHRVGSTQVQFRFTVFTEDQVSDALTGTTIGPGTLRQSFTPGYSSLAAARLRFRAGGGFPAEGYTSTLTLRSGGAFGEVIASASEFIPGPVATGTTLEVTHDFGGIGVSPGKLYVLEWVGPAATVVTWFVSDANPYPGGSMLDFEGEPIAGSDFIFVTYAP